VLRGMMLLFSVRDQGIANDTKCCTMFVYFCRNVVQYEMELGLDMVDQKLENKLDLFDFRGI